MIGLSFLLLAFAAPQVSAQRAEAIELTNQGITLVTQDDPARAEQTLQQAVRVDRSYAPAHYALGRLLLQMREPGEAKAAFEAGLEAAQAGPAPVRARLEYWLGMSRAEAAAEAKSLNDHKALLRESILAFDRALAAVPDHALAHYERARAFDELDDPAEADGAYRKCIELRPTFAPCYVGLGTMYIDYGHENIGIAVLELGTQVAETDGRAWLGIGRAFQRLGKPDAAIEALHKAGMLDPDLVLVDFWLGLAHRDKGDAKATKESLLAFTHRVGSAHEALRHRANAILSGL
jgi:tetratricopeptide (TPR) repeat protein